MSQLRCVYYVTVSKQANWLLWVSDTIRHCLRSRRREGNDKHKACLLIFAALLSCVHAIRPKAIKSKHDDQRLLPPPRVISTVKRYIDGVRMRNTTTVAKVYLIILPHNNRPNSPCQSRLKVTVVVGITI